MRGLGAVGRALRGAAFVVCGACSAKHGPAAGEVGAVGHAALGGEVARVGDTAIGAEVIGAVAAARHDPAPRALDAVVEDALLAQGARVRGVADQAGVRGALSAALARHLLSSIASDARAQGPPTDVERSSLRVVHALVVRGSSLTVQKALELAGEVQRAVAGASTPEAFEARARSVPHAGVRFVVERVGPFSAAGTLPDGSSIDRTFVAASFALASVGDTSPVIETPFGWHTLRLVERVLPAVPTVPAVARDAADAAVDSEADDVLDVRERVALDRVLRERRQAARVELAGALDELLAGASIALPLPLPPPEAPPTGGDPASP